MDPDTLHRPELYPGSTSPRLCSAGGSTKQGFNSLSHPSLVALHTLLETWSGKGWQSLQTGRLPAQKGEGGRFPAGEQGAQSVGTKSRRRKGEAFGDGHQPGSAPWTGTRCEKVSQGLDRRLSLEGPKCRKTCKKHQSQMPRGQEWRDV